MKKLDTLDGVDGLTSLVRKLDHPLKGTTLGYRYELEVAAHFKEAGKNVQFVSLNIVTEAGPTDIDVVVDGVLYQVKRSRNAFGLPFENAEELAQIWLEKARLHLGNAPDDYSGISYVVPFSDVVPDDVAALLQKYNVPIVDNIQHLGFGLEDLN